MKKFFSIISIFFIAFLGFGQTTFALSGEYVEIISVNPTEVTYKIFGVTNGSGLNDIYIEIHDSSGQIVNGVPGQGEMIQLSTGFSNGHIGPVTRTWERASAETPGLEAETYQIKVYFFLQGSGPLVKKSFTLPASGTSVVVDPANIVVQNIDISDVSQNANQVSYDVTGTVGVNQSENVFIRVRDGGAVGPIITTQPAPAEAVTGDSSSGFFTLSKTWTPPQPGPYYIEAFLGSEGSNLLAKKDFIFNERPETVNTEIVNSDDCNENGGRYCLLEPIGTGGEEQLRWVDTTSTGIGKYLNAIFQIGVALAGIFGVLMIVVGGFTYMTSDVVTKKTDGKEQIKNAVLGVLLALLSWLLLNTISSKLIDFEIGIYNTQVSSNGNGSGVEDTLNPITVVDGNYCNAIHQAAVSAVGTFQTCNAPGTDGGNLACAYSVDTIIKAAIGHDINNNGTIQLNTWNMAAELDASPDFYRPVDIGNPPISETHATVTEITQKGKPGDILISTTTGNMIGHASVCDTSGCSQIISNSSAAAEVQRNFALTSATQQPGQRVWSTEYTGIKLHLFRHTSCQ